MVELVLFAALLTAIAWYAIGVMWTGLNACTFLEDRGFHPGIGFAVFVTTLIWGFVLGVLVLDLALPELFTHD